MRRWAHVVVGALLLVACAGESGVATINGERITMSDVPISTDDEVVDTEVFRDALNWLIRDQVLLEAADESFGIRLSENDVQGLAEVQLASLPQEALDDPRANLEYFLIQARLGAQGLLFPRLVDVLPADELPVEWATDRLREADVTVAERFGVWLLEPDPRVYGQ